MLSGSGTTTNYTTTEKTHPYAPSVYVRRICTRTEKNTAPQAIKALRSGAKFYPQNSLTQPPRSIYPLDCTKMTLFGIITNKVPLAFILREI